MRAILLIFLAVSCVFSIANARHTAGLDRRRVIQQMNDNLTFSSLATDKVKPHLPSAVSNDSRQNNESKVLASHRRFGVASKRVSSPRTGRTLLHTGTSNSCSARLYIVTLRHGDCSRRVETAVS